MMLTLAAPKFFRPRLQSTLLSNKQLVVKGHAKEDTAAKRNPDRVSEIFGGELIRDGRVFQQNFAIRSHELDPQGKSGLGSLMKRLQETSVGHCKSIGAMSSGFGSTPEMDKRDLVWVSRKLQIDVDNYPSWGDVIQIDTRTCASGENGLFRDWVFQDYRTGEVLIRATGLYVMMNTKTRRLSKFLPEIRDELDKLLMVTDPVIDISKTKLRQLDVNTETHVRTGLSPTWTDLDMNRHVSHHIYLDFVFESIPISVLENHNVSSIVLEFRKECRMDDILQSLSSPATTLDHSFGKEELRFDHLLRLEDGSAILRGKSFWKPIKR